MHNPSFSLQQFIVLKYKIFKIHHLYVPPREFWAIGTSTSIGNAAWTRGNVSEI